MVDVKFPLLPTYHDYCDRVLTIPSLRVSGFPSNLVRAVQTHVQTSCSLIQNTQAGLPELEILNLAHVLAV